MSWNVRNFGASLTVMTTFLAVTVAHAAELKPKKVTSAGANRTVTYTVAGEGQTAAVTATTSDTWLEIVTPPPATVTLSEGKARVKFTYRVLAKENAGIRSGQVLVNGTPVELVEQAGAPCRLKPASNSTTFQFYGGESSFTYTLPEGCGATVAKDSWISIVHTESVNAVSIEVGQLTGNTRTGKINLSATDPDTGKVTDKKVHTVIQKKRSGAGTTAVGIPTQIKTTEEAAKAAASSIYAAQRLFETGAGLGQFAQKTGPSGSSPRGSVLLSRAIAGLQPAALLSAPAKGSPVVDCTNGGTVTYTGPWTVYRECREKGVEKHGYLSVLPEGDPTSPEGAKGLIKAGKGNEPFRMTTYTDGTYSTETDTMNVMMTLSFPTMKTTQAGASFEVIASGYLDDTFVANEKQTKMLVDAQKLNIGFTQDGPVINVTSDGLLRTTVVYDGNPVTSVELAMDAMEVTYTIDGLFNTSTINMTGNFAIKTYPAASCIDGTFNVAVDPGMPLIHDRSKDSITGGRISVNGIPVVITSDGSATADFPGYEGLPAGNINEVCGI